MSIDRPSADRAPYSSALHSTFNLMNRWAFIPLLRAGLGPLLGTPIGGYFVLLETTGRTSGEPRHAPLLYAIEDGDVYVIAGFGSRTHWYRNLAVDPHARIRLPGRPDLRVVATTVEDPARRIALIRTIAQNGGLSGYLTGVDPWRASDEALARSVGAVPLVRLREVDGVPVRSGPYDPGGRAWIPIQLGLIAVSLVAADLARRATRRLVALAA